MDAPTSDSRSAMLLRGALGLLGLLAVAIGPAALRSRDAAGTRVAPTRAVPGAASLAADAPPTVSRGVRCAAASAGEPAARLSRPDRRC